MKLDSLHLAHAEATRNDDEVFYSSKGDTVYKNTAAGMRSSLDFANSATITASASASNSTIVQRDANGHIFANFFNTTPGNDVTSGVTKVCVETGDDGYIRHGTSDALSTFLGLEDTATTESSASASNSTIVQRDTNGHIWANFFNTSPGNDVTSSVTKVCVETGDDGYIRHGTSDALSTFLGLENSATTVAGDASVGSTIVLRDASGNFSCNNITSTGDISCDHITSGGHLIFGTSPGVAADRQMIDLKTGSKYGIGVQTSTQYYRTDGGFAWFKGGVHISTANDAGTGGALAMKLDDTYNLTVSADVTAYSDKRVKTDISKIDNALEKVCSVSGYTYKRTDTGDERKHTGVIAQEVIKVLPEVVHGSEETTYSVAYGNMVGLLIEAIKEMKSKLDIALARIDTLEKKLEA